MGNVVDYAYCWSLSFLSTRRALECWAAMHGLEVMYNALPGDLAISIIRSTALTVTLFVSFASDHDQADGTEEMKSATDKTHKIRTVLHVESVNDDSVRSEYLTRHWADVREVLEELDKLHCAYCVLSFDDYEWV